MSEYNIPDVKTFEFTKIIGLENIEFGKHIIIDDFVLIYAKEKIRIGDYVHIASYVSVSGGGCFTMGAFSGLASGCRVITGSDDFKSWGFGNPTVSEEFRNVHTGSVTLERFSIVGANSVILPDVTIGEGATIAANSVVTKNVEPWGVYIGKRKVGERDKDAVLATYDRFLNTPESDRLGSLFK